MSQSHKYSTPAPSSLFSWNLLWNSKIHNRHKILFWRIINVIIPCKAGLSVFFNMHNLSCAICNFNVEDANHIFMLCPLIQHAFFISKWNYNIQMFAHFTVKRWIAFMFNSNNTLFSSCLLRNEFIVFVCII